MATYKDMLLDIIQPTTERQYGGGLDDAYMNRRSAFAAPDANNAFASPMSQGGLPTIYREDGGTTVPKERMINDQPHQLSYINPEEAGLLQALGGSGRMVDGIPSYYSVDDFDQEDADAGAASFDLDGNYGGVGGDGNYETIGEVTKQQAAAPSEEASIAADRENAARFADIGLDMQQKFGGDAGNRLINYGGRRGDVSAMPQGAYSMLWSIPGMTMDKINNMTPQTLEGFSKAFSGDASLDGSTGYRFGGPAGTLQDLLEQEAGRDFDYDDLLETDKQGKELKKDAMEQEAKELSTAELAINGVKGFYDNISNFLSVKSDLDPSTLSNIEARAKEQGLTYTPSSNVLGNIMNFGIGMIPGGNVLKGLASLTGGGKTIGTITNEKTGMSFNLSDTGKMSMIEGIDAPDTTGSDNDSIDRRPRPVQQKITERVTDEVIETPDIADDRTIKERGLLPQYEALRRAKYTKEEAIKAIGAPIGTELT